MNIDGMNPIRTYYLTGGQLDLYYHPAEGVSALFSGEEGKKYISSAQILGIQKEAFFNEEVLRRYLEATYARYIAADQPEVRISVALRGGGWLKKVGIVHNKHHRSDPVVQVIPPQPLPPRAIPVVYSAGLTIRSLECVPVAGGNYEPPVGGIGQTTLSVNFVSNNYTLSPIVKVGVWKRDYHAQKIATLRAEKVPIDKDLATPQKTKADHEKEIQRLLAEIEGVNKSINDIEGQLNPLSVNLPTVEASTKKLQQELAEARKGIVAMSPQIQSLAKFLVLNQETQLGIDVSHPAVVEFTNLLSAYKPLLGIELDGTTLFGQIVSSLEKVQNEAKKAENQELVAVVGNTGTGKSTIVNHLLDVPLQIGKDQVVEAVHPKEEIAKIGHQKATSETTITQVCTKAGIPFIFADCGGLYDTRGTAMDLLVAASVKFTLAKANAVKVIICIDSALLDSARGSLLTTALKNTLGGLIQDYKAQANSILVLFTKPTKQLNGAMLTTQDVKESLAEIVEELKGKEEAELYQFLLRDEGKYVAVYDPLKENSQVETKAILGSMKAIPKTENAFHISYSTDSKKELLEQMIALTVRANEAFTKYKTVESASKESEKKEADLRASITAHQQRLAPLVTSREAKNKDVKDRQAKITALNPTITTLEQKQREKVTAIAALDTEDIVTQRYQNGAWTWL